ncbi:hypothetical protein HUB97_11045 [Halorubraceae archaeon YAN]|nr:hypothetical protein [Halorubraceae archaeon YAN]
MDRNIVYIGDCLYECGFSVSVGNEEQAVEQLCEHHWDTHRLAIDPLDVSQFLQRRSYHGGRRSTNVSSKGLLS